MSERANGRTLPWPTALAPLPPLPILPRPPPQVRLGHTHRNDAIDDAASKHSSSKRFTAHRGFESEAEGEGSKDGSRSNGSSRDRKRKRSRAPFSPSKVPELRVPPLVSRQVLYSSRIKEFFFFSNLRA